MPSPDEAQPSRIALSARREAYRGEIQRIVREGAEHPTCELVREMPLKTSEHKVDFAKLLQGLGNAIITGERLLVIGADQGGRKFVGVANLNDFDPARVSQLLSKYLDTLPLFESFAFEADGGESFVVIVIAPKQPKPLVAKADIQGEDGRFLLHKGDIWIKENTGLRRAVRSDLDSIYEDESEARARRWFDRLSGQLLSSRRLGDSGGVPIPQADLIYGDAQAFRLYVQTLIAGNHQRQFLMLLDLLRDLAIDGWNKIDGYSTQPAENTMEYVRAANDHTKDYFLPAAKGTVELGLLLIKHSADMAWLDLVARLLADVFDSSARLVKLSVATVFENDVLIGFGRYLPALEAVVGVRALALYALRRERYDALSFLMKRYVSGLVPPRRVQLPFLFWPFPDRIKMPEGLIAFSWRHRIESSWREYFGSSEEYLRLASQLEFFLEFNSWLGVSPEGRTWLAEHKKDTTLVYYADIWRSDLNSVVGVSERLFEGLRGQDPILTNVMVERILLDVRLKVVSQNPELLLAAYLDYVIRNQAKVLVRMGKLPNMVDWGEKIGRLLKDYRERKENGALPTNLAFSPE